MSADVKRAILGRSSEAAGRVLAALVVAAGALAAAGCRTPVEIVREVPIFKEVLPDPPFPEGWRVVDLTQRLDASAPHAAHPRAFPFERMDLAPAEPGGLRTGAITAMDQTGTHLTAPRARDPKGATVDTWGRADLLLPLVVIEAPEGTDTVPAQVVLDDVRERGDLPARAVVVLRTPKGARRAASWSEDAARLLVRDMRAYVVGAEGIGLDADSETKAPAQAAVAAAGAWQLGGLRSLADLPMRGAFVVVGCLPVADGAGAPARVVALVPPRSRNPLR